MKSRSKYEFDLGFCLESSDSIFICLQGWVVEATSNIPAYTLICEYTGEVDYTRHHLFDGDDDIMDLIRSGRSRTRYARVLRLAISAKAIFQFSKSKKKSVKFDVFCFSIQSCDVSLASRQHWSFFVWCEQFHCRWYQAGPHLKCLLA
jgi:hypothetical protein